MKKTLIFAIVAMFIAPLAAWAQDTNTDSHQLKVIIPHVALLDIEPAGSKDIELEATAPTEAGDPLTWTDSDNTLWLNYSVIRLNATTSKKVQVNLSALVPGVDIKLVVGAYAGAGLGNKGASAMAAATTLTTTDQDAITSIGSSYTVDGANNGHQLTYTFDLKTGDYGDLYANDHTVTVTYTLVDE